MDLTVHTGRMVFGKYWTLVAEHQSCRFGRKSRAQSSWSWSWRSQANKHARTCVYVGSITGRSTRRAVTVHRRTTGTARTFDSAVIEFACARFRVNTCTCYRINRQSCRRQRATGRARVNMAKPPVSSRRKTYGDAGTSAPCLVSTCSIGLTKGGLRAGTRNGPRT